MRQDHDTALRRHDPDRFLTTLFAPASRRDALVTLYAFNHQLARAPEVAREPGLALIRLHWWREVVDGAARAHEVATPLRAALDAGQLHAPDLLAMVEAREREVEGEFADVAAWQDWLVAGAGALAAAAGHALGAPAPALDRLRRLGAGYGVAGQLRSVAAFARQGRCLLPADLLARHGLTAELVVANPRAETLAPVRATLAGIGAELLGRPERCAADWVAAALPAVLARRDLMHPSRAETGRGLGDRLAVIAAALRCRA